MGLGRLIHNNWTFFKTFLKNIFWLLLMPRKLQDSLPQNKLGLTSGFTNQYGQNFLNYFLFFFISLRHFLMSCKFQAKKRKIYATTFFQILSLSLYAHQRGPPLVLSTCLVSLRQLRKVFFLQVLGAECWYNQTSKCCVSIRVYNFVLNFNFGPSPRNIHAYIPLTLDNSSVQS